jgi:hypothetical protein
MEEDERSGKIGTRRSVIARVAGVVRISGIGSGNHVSKPRMFTSEYLGVTVSLEDL